MKRIAIVFTLVLGLAFCLAAAGQAQEKAPGVVVLKGNPMGGVKFNHPAHAKVVGDKCDTCHHASKTEKPAKEKQGKCQECHTKAVAAPMVTTAKLAFHDAMAKKGTCIDCHLKEPAVSKKAPLKCPECHKKGNT